MIKSAFHYLQRSRELGLSGTFRRAWKRSLELLKLQGQALWWSWVARQEMSDAALLARTSGNWSSVSALSAHLAERPASSFLFPHESTEETTQFLEQFYPAYGQALFNAAEAACRNELPLLGQVFHFPEGINWHCDPVTGWRWPRLHRSLIGQYLGSERPVDLIFFWELNRHQHFITLGMAYWLTGGQKYLEAFSAQLHQWIKTNPVQQGVNWYYPLEVAIRLLAWTAAFQFFRGSLEFQAKVAPALLKSLWQQADFLNHHLQITRSTAPNNHLMAELTGLVLVGTAFPEFRAAAEWRATGLRLIREQAVAQTYPDGVNQEQATGYHRFVTELLLLIVARSRQGDLPISSTLEQTLEKMLDYALFCITPAGTAPLWGDSDYGRALGLGLNKDFWDFRPLLSAGAVLFNRPDWKFAAGRFDEEAFWLLGVDGLKRWGRIEAQTPEQTSRAFPDAGQYILRDAWAPNTDLAFFRCGALGLGGEGHCAHAHSDLLSFTLWIKGQPLLVDSGTYMYHGPLRDYFRLTSAHNTVTVDGHDQATPKPNFNWQEISNATCVNWSGKSVTGKLNYYGVEFLRTLTHPQPGIWQIEDQFSGNDSHKIDWFFNFSPDLAFELAENERKLKVFKAGLTFLTVHLPGQEIKFELVEAWSSDRYGVKEPTQKLHASWLGNLKEAGEKFNWQFELNASDAELSGDQHATH